MQLKWPWAKGGSIPSLWFRELDDHIRVFKALFFFFFFFLITASLWWLRVKIFLFSKKEFFFPYLRLCKYRSSKWDRRSIIYRCVYKAPLCARHGKGTCVCEGGNGTCTTILTWKQPKCPSTNEWIKKMWDIYICIYIYTPTPTPTHTYIHIHINKDTHTHTYIHTHTPCGIYTHHVYIYNGIVAIKKRMK